MRYQLDRRTMVIALAVLLALLSESVATTELPNNLLVNQTGIAHPGGRCDFEEGCTWKWNTSVPHGFRVVTAAEASGSSTGTGVYHGPTTDANNNTYGHFLYLNVSPDMRELHNVWSSKYSSTGEKCRLELSLFMASMVDGNFKVVVETVNKTSWVITERRGNNLRRWDEYNFKVGRVSQEFYVILEIVPNYYRYSSTLAKSEVPPIVAIDDIKLTNCFPGSYNYPVRLPEVPPVKTCSALQFQCDNGTCIDHSFVCDFIPHCKNGEDEKKSCDKVPPFSHCDFEEGWCGWTNRSKHLNGLSLNWTRHCGSTPTRHTGPSFDHTYKNITGMYAFVDVSTKKTMGAAAVLESAVFHRPPSYHSNSLSAYYNSCHIRFHYHQFGPHSGSLSMNLVEMHQKENHSTNLWWSYGDKGDSWFRQVVVLPNITRRYFVTFEARRGIALRGDIALDDISMSPECFGIGVPPNEVKDYDYNRTEPDLSTDEHRDFVNKTYYLLTSCGIEGRAGPKQANCTAAYNNTVTRVVVLDKPGVQAGVQEWIVPETGYYTIIAKGAKGGKGSDRKGASRGASVRTVVELNKGQRIYVLVGQEGTSACSKDLSTRTGVCQPVFTADTNKSTLRPPNPITKILKMEIEAGGGGGGGGTFVYTLDKEDPMLVAGGGGGLGLTQGLDDGRQHGQGVVNATMEHISGNIYGPMPAGAGGGWFRNKDTSWHNSTGEAITHGGKGGFACLGQNGQGWGGFGGGGGGCSAGGGGGGFAGGDAWSDKDFSGEGGYSYIGRGDFGQVQEGEHEGSGAVYIIPAIQGCECDYRCAAMDEFRQKTRCLCPAEWFLSKNGMNCVLPEVPPSILHISVIVVCASVSVLVMALLGIWLYSGYQRKRNGRMRRRMLNGPDLQLNRLREASNSMMTEFNPNYEFGGATYTIRDLKDIPRDHLRLVKALGQGAFGEVYQGFFRHRDGDAVEMPVAVKVSTLPELSTNQAETDFLMEALIMSKFNHPNIVHFIGVCFDKHPRFIVLELLAGGDLKTFLRESRPKPERPSPLLMKDLLLCSMDIAKGCKYMEENRFIHRDIAARNCLLTTKGPGRVVKIADFGMARDIYRADYYRKGGKAMLPIKWMPPEAFLDGIFTTKTDVWSFGVLLWEVMSLGYMPYTGCANRDVMQLVTSGGRLEPPSNCPGPLYGIMTQCWHPKPEERPGFSTILERLDYCIQDPDVMNAPLPVFYRPPSSERDATIMRPPAHENSCLQVPRNADYLVPLPCVLPELPSSPSANSVDKLLSNGLYDDDPDLVTDWETSFVIPESRSTQPLLDGEPTCSGADAGAGPGATSNNLGPYDKTSPKNHNNNNNINARSSLKGSLSLDPANLQGKQSVPYLKVNITPSHVNHVSTLDQDTGRPYTVQGSSSRHRHADAGTEISC